MTQHRHLRRRTLAAGALASVALAGAGLSALQAVATHAIPSQCAIATLPTGRVQKACLPTPTFVTGCARPTLAEATKGVTVPKAVRDAFVGTTDLGPTDVCFTDHG